MYRTGDPRFRRRLNELESTLERANETAQSSIYTFGQTYIRPCLQSVTSCLSTCVQGSCPCLETPHDRLRRQRARSRGQNPPELSFDFYDDWDEDENDALLGWGYDESDNVADAPADYGAMTNTQPGLQQKMSYGTGRRKSTGLAHAAAAENTNPSLLGKLFGGRSLRYAPSAAGLQDRPSIIKKSRDGENTDCAVLPPGSTDDCRRRGRARSATSSSGQTTDSYSSRGDIFPSDDENDAIPLDDEFAMVLERRTTQSGDLSATEVDDKPSKISLHTAGAKRGKRSSMGTRQSSRRTVSTRSTGSTVFDANSENEYTSRVVENNSAGSTDVIDNHTISSPGDIVLTENHIENEHDNETAG